MLLKNKLFLFSYNMKIDIVLYMSLAIIYDFVLKPIYRPLNRLFNTPFNLLFNKSL